MNENVKDTMTSHIVKEIKDIDNNVTGVIVPILRDNCNCNYGSFRIFNNSSSNREIQ